MHFHLPKPLHGWREFVGEIGVIVIGILIALTGEQLVERWHWRNQVAETRESLNGDLALARANAIVLTVSHDCLKRRLSALDKLTEENSSLPDLQVNLFGMNLWSTATWESAAASGAIAHMPIDERNRYATLFSVIDSLGKLDREAFETAAELSTMSRHSQLTDVSRDRLQADIARLQVLNDILFIGAKQFADRTERLHLHLGREALSEIGRVRRRSARCAMPQELSRRGD